MADKEQKPKVFKSYVFSRADTVEIPAPHFEGAKVGPALLDLLGLSDESSYGFPDVQIKLRGSKECLVGLKIVTNRCKFDEATGHIKVVVRKPGGPYYGEENYRTLHFLKDDTGSHSHADIIKSMILGYSRWETTRELINTHLGMGIRIFPDGTRKEFALPKEGVA